MRKASKLTQLRGRVCGFSMTQSAIHVHKIKKKMGPLKVVSKKIAQGEQLAGGASAGERLLQTPVYATNTICTHRNVMGTCRVVVPCSEHEGGVWYRVIANRNAASPIPSGCSSSDQTSNNLLSSPRNSRKRKLSFTVLFSFNITCCEFSHTACASHVSSPSGSLIY